MIKVALLFFAAGAICLSVSGMYWTQSLHSAHLSRVRPVDLPIRLEQGATYRASFLPEADDRYNVLLQFDGLDGGKSGGLPNDPPSVVCTIDAGGNSIASLDRHAFGKDAYLLGTFAATGGMSHTVALAIEQSRPELSGLAPALRVAPTAQASKDRDLDMRFARLWCGLWGGAGLLSAACGITALMIGRRRAPDRPHN